MLVPKSDSSTMPFDYQYLYDREFDLARRQQDVLRTNFTNKSIESDIEFCLEIASKLNIQNPQIVFSLPHEVCSFERFIAASDRVLPKGVRRAYVDYRLQGAKFMCNQVKSPGLRLLLPSPKTYGGLEPPGWFYDMSRADQFHAAEAIGLSYASRITGANFLLAHPTEIISAAIRLRLKGGENLTNSEFIFDSGAYRTSTPAPYEDDSCRVYIESFDGELRVGAYIGVGSSSRDVVALSAGESIA